MRLYIHIKKIYMKLFSFSARTKMAFHTGFAPSSLPPFLPLLQLPTRCQFYQHFTSTFFVLKCIFDSKILYKSASRSFVIFGAKILYKKCVRKTLMKLTPVVNFLTFYKKHFDTNVLCEAFMYIHYVLGIVLVQENQRKSCL